MRIVVCGIGNTERGDDAFGPYVVEHLQESDMLKKLDCGLYPENYLNRIISLSPDLVILVDTIDKESRNCVLLRSQEIFRLSTVSVSTHNLSLGAMCEFLIDGGVKDIFFLGMPAFSYECITTPVKETADRIIGVLNNIDIGHRVCIIDIYEALSEQIR
ncbi:MAG: hydrogenase maturation protease [candidate division WOR-3 bacterium]|nr:hydrogenase maturation protease [candidate division WOR-3 bacterium]